VIKKVFKRNTAKPAQMNYL